MGRLTLPVMAVGLSCYLDDPKLMPTASLGCLFSGHSVLPVSKSDGASATICQLWLLAGEN